MKEGQKFAVIGHPIGHSLSPKMHSANFEAIGFAATYEKFDVAPEDVASFVFAKRDEGYRGLNVTVPHKLAVIELLGHVDESVARYGACNTIRFEDDGTLTGFNTDVIGFVAGLAAHGYALAGKKVFIIGCGGAGSALATACKFENAAEVFVADIDAVRAEELAAKIDAKVVRGDWAAVAAGVDIVVNATTVGLHEGDESVLPQRAFHPGQFVLDIVPTKDFPPTAAAAKAAGADAADGLEFLVGQGAKSFELWTGLKADARAMLDAIRS